MIVRPRTEVMVLIERGAVARARTRAACLDSIVQLNNQAQNVRERREQPKCNAIAKVNGFWCSAVR
jgi:hypothetical protein